MFYRFCNNTYELFTFEVEVVDINYFLVFAELKPVFVINGSSGVGKSVILHAVSKRLGANYKRIDCNNIISNTVTQIKSNVLHAFKEAKNSSPVILHFSHAEVLIFQLIYVLFFLILIFM